MNPKSFIHRLLALSLMATVAMTVFAASTSKVVKLTFSEDMFKINMENGVVQEVIYVKDVAPLPGDTALPALPIVPFTVSAGPNVDCTFTPTIASKKLILEDVDVATAPQILPTNMLGKVGATTRGRYTGPLYPTKICTFNGKSEWSDVTYLHFSCSPFIYDSRARKLYLVEELDVDITATDRLSDKKLAAARLASMTPKPSFIRPPLDSLLKPGLDSSHFADIPIDTAILVIEPPHTDYLIITNEALKSSFEPLLKWKNTKGLATNIVTVENIYKYYPGADNAAKIKNYLRMNAFNEKYKYVLLGGDDNVVPVRYCAGDPKDFDTQYNTPADIYYACINDPYDWDMNGDGIYGDEDDEVCIEASFAVTRLPLTYPDEISNYIKRVIEYEMAPQWNNSALFAGTTLFYPNQYPYPEENIIASAKAKAIYSECVRPMWKGKIDLLFDNENTLGYNSGQNSMVFSSSNLGECLKQGYNFVNIITHGKQTQFDMQPWLNQQGQIITEYGYTNSDATLFWNPGHTIITTSACHTNAFDQITNLSHVKSSRCLSESFLGSGKSGVLAYLGASRYGYYSVSNSLSQPGPSVEYEQKFYSTLFGENAKSKKFGDIVTSIKHELGCGYDFDHYKWLNYCINPMGDPEMPIFTEEPNVFSGIETAIDNRTIEITVDEPDCVISIRGLGSETGYKKTFSNKTFVTATDLPEQFAVCVTKQNFLPWVYGFNRLLDETYSMTALTNEDIFKENFGLGRIKGLILDVQLLSESQKKYKIFTSVSESANEAYIAVCTVLSGIMTCNRYPIEKGESSVIISTSGMSRFSPCIVQLIVDGDIEDTLKIM